MRSRLSLLAMTFFMFPNITLAQEVPPAKTCQQQCQPMGKMQVCNKHCWSYRGGPGGILVQTTVTWSSVLAVAQHAKPKPQLSSAE